MGDDPKVVEFDGHKFTRAEFMEMAAWLQQPAGKPFLYLLKQQGNHLRDNAYKPARAHKGVPIGVQDAMAREDGAKAAALFCVLESAVQIVEESRELSRFESEKKGDI